MTELPSKERWVALDAIRALAVLMMVQGHAFFAVLSDEVRAESWYGIHAYIHGYTAPLFLFSAGCAFGLMTFRRLPTHIVWGSAVWKRCERYALIIGVGYVMHWMVPTLSWLQGLGDQQLAYALRIDALQHIGVVLVFFMFIVFLLRRRRAIRGAVFVVALLSVFAAPWLWRQDLASMNALVAAYVGDATGSVFPLCPWMGFIAFGILVGSSWDAVGPTKLARGTLFGGGMLLLVASLLSSSQPIDFGAHYYWKTNPWFFFVRLAVLLLLLGAVGWIAGRFSGLATLVSTRLGRTLSQETLSIYIAHLCLLYLPNWGLDALFPRTLTLSSALLVTTLVLLGSVALATLWASAKRRFPTKSQTTVRLFALAFVVLFLLG